MNNERMAVLAVILISMLCVVKIAEAETMKSKSLNAKQEKIVPIAAFTASGDLAKLKMAVGDGLDGGLTVSEIREILVQLYAYCGFPRSLNALDAFMGVLDERKKRGIKDDPGREASPLPAGKSSIELGTENQTFLSGKPVAGPIYTFAPVIDRFLKGHLFGDIFGRDVLDFRQREIATISALAAMKGVNPQLQAHLNIGLNVGLSGSQLKSLVSVLEAKVGRDEADNARETLNAVLKNRAD